MSRGESPKDWRGPLVEAFQLPGFRTGRWRHIQFPKLLAPVATVSSAFRAVRIPRMPRLDHLDLVLDRGRSEPGRDCRATL